MTVISRINLDDIYDKNINFLIGAGASFGLFPTLSVDIKDEEGNDQTIETLTTEFSKSKQDDTKNTLLFMHYYKTCIEPVMVSDFELDLEIFGNEHENNVLKNYTKFIDTVISILEQKQNFEKRCNIYTTNYDSCFTYTADSYLKNGSVDFVINDGARGFRNRYIHSKNYNSYLCQTGVFERHQSDIPQINLIHLHGSTNWYKDGDNILVDYSLERNQNRKISNDIIPNLDVFSSILMDKSKVISDLPPIDLDDKIINKFWREYNELPIVNPTKWKFHETVFDEYYYQMLRMLSYDLEKPNSVLITFGFSFADEHILNLVKRSLTNPKLQVFICCFNQDELEKMKQYFERYKNVQYITTENLLDFNKFNSDIFTIIPNDDTHTESEG